MSDGIHEVSLAIGQLQSDVKAVLRAQEEAREQHNTAGLKLDCLTLDVAGVKSDVAGLKHDVGEIKPTVKVLNEGRLKIIGAIIAISMFSGLAGAVVRDRLFG